MRGSLAIWYDPLHTGEVKGRPPEIELHFNLWRDLNIEVNFFDVGILFKDIQDLNELFFFIPIELEISDLTDLFPKMSEGDTLNAVFNDVVEIKRNEGNYITTTTRRGSFHTLHRVEPISDFTLSTVAIDSESKGTVVALSKEFCQRLRGMPGDHYIRLRFPLEKKKGELFSSYFAPKDAPLLSSFGLIEITEFRLNERRSYPKAIVERSNMGNPRITAIHYFLVRDLRYELVASHADFRKVRRLEADLWQHYIADLPSNAGDRMVIYHWKAEEKDGNGVEDFVALANFRVPQPNLPIYLVLLLVFGALGGVLQDSLVAGFKGCRVVAAHHRLARMEERMARGDRTSTEEWKQYDWQFHQALISACGSKMLIDTHAAVFDKYLRYQMIALSYRGAIAAGEHALLLGCALQRDAEQACEVLRHHVAGGVEHALATGTIT